MVGKKKVPPERRVLRVENTMQFRVLSDPELDGIVRQADQEPSRMEGHRSFFSGYQLAHSNDAGGLNYDAFVSNIRAGGSMLIGTQDVFLFFTRSAAFIMFKEVPDFNYLHEAFPGIDFVGKASMLEPKERGPPIVRIRMTGAELIALRHPSAADPRDFIEAEFATQRIIDVRAMLAECRVLSGEPDFDLRDFLGRIAICEIRDGEHGSKSYFVAIDGDMSHTRYLRIPRGPSAAWTMAGKPIT